MLTLFVVAKEADTRTSLVSKINSFLQSELALAVYLPQVSIKPLSLDELKFHTAPDVCILGDDFKGDFVEIAKVRSMLPETVLLYWLGSEQTDFFLYEQLAGIGIDDTLEANLTASDFIRKLLLTAGKKKNSKHHSQLIVVGAGKGGVGVTSITAAIAEGLLANGYKTVVIDTDYETQDLSRFLQARPYVNENLQKIFDKQCAVTQESVEDCLVQVWEDDEKLKCMPPVVESETIYDARSSYPRSLLAILEVLDGLFDFIVVDAANLKNTMLRTILRAADELVYVINNDPAALYAGVNRLMQYKSWMSSEAKLTLLENMQVKNGLSSNFLKQEFQVAVQLTPADTYLAVPYSFAGGRWIASGGTLYSRSATKTVKALQQLVNRLIPQEWKQQEKTDLLPVVRTLARRAENKSYLSLSAISNSAKERIKKLATFNKDKKALPAPAKLEEKKLVEQKLVERKLIEQGQPKQTIVSKASLISGAQFLSK